MSNLDQLARDAGAEVRDQLAFIEPPTAGAIARRSRQGRLATGLAAIAVLALAGAGLAITRQHDPEPTRLQVTDEPAPPTTLPANGWVASFNGIWLERYGATSGPKEVLEGNGTQACPAFSPDGERLMFGREDDAGAGTLEIVSVAEDGRASPLSTIPLDIEDSRNDIPCAIWAPDGRWAALGGDGSVWVVDTETGEVRQLPVSEAADLEWRPGTDQLAITGQAWPDPNTPIDIYTVSTGEIRTIGVEAVQFTWSPDGTTIAYSQGVPGVADTMSGISLVDADGTNRRTLTTDDWVEQGIGPVWSPRGDKIVYQRERLPTAPTPLVMSAARSSSSPRPTMIPRTRLGPSAPSRPSRTTSTERLGSTRSGGTRTASRGHRTALSCCTPATLACCGFPSTPLDHRSCSPTTAPPTSTPTTPRSPTSRSKRGSRSPSHAVGCGLATRMSGSGGILGPTFRGPAACSCSGRGDLADRPSAAPSSVGQSGHEGKGHGGARGRAPVDGGDLRG